LYYFLAAAATLFPHNPGEGFKTDPVKITESGTYYLKVRKSGSSKLEEYSLELTIDKAAAAEESKLP
jgi:hypothetical protein